MISFLWLYYGNVKLSAMNRTIIEHMGWSRAIFPPAFPGSTVHEVQGCAMPYNTGEL
jgi:hypothetical protein